MIPTNDREPPKSTQSDPLPHGYAKAALETQTSRVAIGGPALAVVALVAVVGVVVIASRIVDVLETHANTRAPSSSTLREP